MILIYIIINSITSKNDNMCYLVQIQFEKKIVANEFDYY